MIYRKTRHEKIFKKLKLNIGSKISLVDDIQLREIIYRGLENWEKNLNSPYKEIKDLANVQNKKTPTSRFIR